MRHDTPSHPGRGGRRAGGRASASHRLEPRRNDTRSLRHRGRSGASGAIVDHFPAGEVMLSGIDSAEDGVISLTDSITVPREPFTIDASRSPALIEKATPLVGGSGNYDP